MVLFRSIFFGATLVIEALATPSKFVPRSFNNATDVDLGFLDSVDSFFELLGTNSSDWDRFEDAAEEVFDPNAFSPNPDNVLMARQMEQCLSLTDWTQLICDNMPNNKVKYALGAAIAIYYAPIVLVNWLENCGKLIHGRDYVWQSRKASELDKRDDIASVVASKWNGADHLYFKVPQVFDSLQTRSVDELGVASEATLYNEYSFDTATSTIHYRASGGTFHAEMPEVTPEKRWLGPRQLSRDYVIFLEVHRATAAGTTASYQCIGKTLRYFVDRSSERHRSSCQPMHNRGSFMSNVNIHITPGSTGRRLFDCC
ncbi:uncharacterized protein CTRU02_209004 [Colletotrichum truncatum]|uniref:Uncharacterized protein n=1 Tax=Colletotrichum truncatum TaxID=5467 RepID=A0ACC3YY04_COLTU|nr:uncharacterized protein CTRU02_07804 [Colletotrichum truncatum]KAF6790898.1 hypothetical protein CTRU02_07804 [Colletotrichum truncatum]